MTGLGDCFPTAGRLVLADPDLMLVHGLVTDWAGEVGEHWHAWAEQLTRTEWPAGAELNGVTIPEGGLTSEVVTCIDRSNGHDVTVPALMFYRLGDVRLVHRYTSAEAEQLVLATGHWGPWADSEVAP